LIAAIEEKGIRPRLIIVDTLAQTLGAGDENGTGMVQFVANATALATHFRALVLVVHHVGLGDGKRMRGHSSLHAGVDAQVLCQRKGGSFSTTLTLQKLKDETDEIQLEAQLSRTVIRLDEDGQEISTLIVDHIKNIGRSTTSRAGKKPPPQLGLLIEVVEAAIVEVGRDVGTSTKGQTVKGVSDDIVRERYYARIAEQAESGEDPTKLANKQRQAFNRSVKSALDGKHLGATEVDGKRSLFLPLDGVTAVTPLKGCVTSRHASHLSEAGQSETNVTDVTDVTLSAAEAEQGIEAASPLASSDSGLFPGISTGALKANNTDAAEAPEAKPADVPKEAGWSMRL
jgi:hypothetical protein